MKIMIHILIVLILSFCESKNNIVLDHSELVQSHLKVGAENTEKYFSLLKDKNIAVAVNQTSIINNMHLVDSLISKGFKIRKIFSPEHGFRGQADAGEHVLDSVDEKTNIPLISLYGSKKKASKQDLEGIDVILFDIQDVGVRFYTYISSLHYFMESAAEIGIPLIVLDRPNPNIHYIDGPVLKPEFKSFVGMHPVPVVYGMTIGEYARMINGENWLAGDVRCDLKVIDCSSYKRSDRYILPIMPSPNLPNINSILHYPSLCFFEPSSISIGRGTDFPFQTIAHPDFKDLDFKFIPESKSGAKNPKHKGNVCFGEDLRKTRAKNESLDLTWLIKYYNKCVNSNLEFFTNERFFNLLAGNDSLVTALKEGRSETEIRESWKQDLIKFKAVRAKYLVYPD